MPEQIRDNWSKAIIFVPTQEEKLYERSRKALDKELEEVRALKDELKELLAAKKD